MTKKPQQTKEKSNSTRTQSKHVVNTQVLNDDINAAIASNIIATTPAPDVASRIKSKLMHRVQEQAHRFVFANQGEWKIAFEGVCIKLLHQDGEHKSFLIKMAANSSIPSHAHTQNEESFVIEGSVELEGILCHVGDYHFAKMGSKHQAIKSSEGCVLLVKSM
jgi:anti-sigma factor ChrR (cupin superfamily)